MNALATGLLSFLALSSLFAQPFRYTLKEGQVRSYKVMVSLDGNLPMPGGLGGDGNMKVSSEMFFKVKKTLESGDSETEAGLTQIDIELNGQPLTLALDMVKQYIPDNEAVVSNRGEVKKVKGGGQLPVQLPGFDPRNMVSLFMPTILPEGGLEPGAAWEFKHKFGEGATEFITPMKAKFEAWETIDGVRLMRIGHEFEAKTSTTTLKGTMTVWLDPAKGLLQKSDLKGTYETKADADAQPMKARTSILVELLPEPKKP